MLEWVLSECASGRSSVLLESHSTMLQFSVKYRNKIVRQPETDYCLCGSLTKPAHVKKMEKTCLIVLSCLVSCCDFCVKLILGLVALVVIRAFFPKYKQVYYFFAVFSNASKVQRSAKQFGEIMDLVFSLDQECGRMHYTKKSSFPLKISSVNVTKSAGNCGFGDIYSEEIINGKFSFLYSVALIHFRPMFPFYTP